MYLAGRKEDDNRRLGTGQYGTRQYIGVERILILSFHIIYKICLSADRLCPKISHIYQLFS